MSFLSVSTGRTGQSSQGPYGGRKRAPAGRLAAVSQSLWDGPNVRGVRLHRGEPLLHEPHRQNRDGGPLQRSLQGETAGRKIRRNQEAPGNGRDAVLGSVSVSPEIGPSCLGPRISGINIRYTWVVGGVVYSADCPSEHQGSGTPEVDGGPGPVKSCSAGPPGGLVAVLTTDISEGETPDE